MSSENSCKKKYKFKGNIAIIALLLVSAFLNMWNIWMEGFANEYYAAGVYSMGQNLHAFFFNSFDSIGFVSIDKPPLGFWIQVIFTKIFGFSGTVLILPQAIASVLSVYLIYSIVKTRFSKEAGLAAAAVLAFSPIFVAVSRNNTIDGILILFMLLAANQTLIATEKASMKHLILAGVFIGLGFNVKMLQAYMIVPAIYLTYLVLAKQKFMKKILVCAVSVIVMVVISLSWIVAVDLVPEENRPYVGSSTKNSAVELAIGYNGINRIFQMKQTGGINNNIINQPDSNQPLINSQILNIGNNKRAGNEESDIVGLFRLYNHENAGQIAWFILPAVYICFLIVWMVIRKKFKSNSQNTAMLFFALCFIPMFVYFSFTDGIAHRYYFATFAPFIAGLTGIAFYYLYRGKKLWFPIVFISVAAVQIYIQYLYGDWIKSLILIMALVFGVAAIIMLIGTFTKIKRGVFAMLMCTLLILPAIWSATPIVYHDNSQLPITGPELTEGGDYFDRDFDFTSLIEYLEENRDDEDYLVVTSSSMKYAARIMLQSGEPVIALGGFIGGDTIVSLDEFINMVENDEVRYAYICDDRDKANRAILKWIKDNGEFVMPFEYGKIEPRIMKLYRLN